VERAASGPASFLDEIRAHQKVKGERCTTGVFVSSLTADQREAISAARAEGIPGTAIGHWLRSLGFEGGVESVVRHIGGRCKCQPS
jgi:hypothetical protein